MISADESGWKKAIYAKANCGISPTLVLLFTEEIRDTRSREKFSDLVNNGSAFGISMITEVDE